MEYTIHTKCVLRVWKGQSKSIQKNEEDDEKKQIEKIEEGNIVPPLPAQETGHNRMQHKVRVGVLFLQV